MHPRHAIPADVFVHGQRHVGLLCPVLCRVLCIGYQVASYNEHTIALCAPDAASGTALLSMEFLKDLRSVTHSA